MRIVIDMQGAQTESRFREIGSYTLSLAQAIARNRGEHEIILALNSLFPDTIESIRIAFDGLLSEENICIWYAPGPVRESEPGNEWRREVAERIREAFLASLRADVVFIPSFFEGYEDNGVVSIGSFDQQLTTVVAINRLDNVDNIGDNPDVNVFTLLKIEYLKRANLLLALSPLNENEICSCLKIPHERVKVGLMVGESGTNQHEANNEAKNLINIFEELTAVPLQVVKLPLSRRLKLAYISPLPPERSGISDYSAELLPELARFYDIDVIIAQEKTTDPWITSNCGVQAADWFVKNAHQYDRVLYHFGNSGFHQHMFDLLANIPGAVVLHDFYLGDVQWCRDTRNNSQFTLAGALYQSHGYAAVAEYFHASSVTDSVRKFPLNLEVLQQSQGIIVHSEYSRHLASKWYGHQFSADWAVIPLLRAPVTDGNRDLSRQQLGLKSDDYVVCSFGLLGVTKLNQHLLDAWLHSGLIQDRRCILVFVGENDNTEYGTRLMETIRTSKLDQRIRITGWVDMATYRNYLAAADLAVQLRTNSRGETSAAVLDCMNYALPTIVNANGSMADLSSDTVWVLPDIFEDHQLVEALETLWHNDEKRSGLGQRAQEIIRTRHAPDSCAEQYVEAIEQFYARSQCGTHALDKAIVKIEGYSPTDAEYRIIAQNIAQSLPAKQPLRQLLLDISTTCQTDLKTGIERVARAMVMGMLKSPPAGFRVEPVYLSNEGGAWHYRYASRYTLGLLDCPADELFDEVVEPQNGDLLLGLDLSGQILIEAEAAGLFTCYRNAGVKVHFIVYDLLPLQLPQFFPSGLDASHAQWLHAITKFDGAVCISRAVADELNGWLKTDSLKRQRPFRIGWFHLGADMENSAPTCGLPKNAGQTLAKLKARPSFLMVGTLEPRKGYLQTLEAFTQLWQEGVDINLVIVGSEGWKGLPKDMRRTIPEIVNCLRNHPELNKRLFWLEAISDEFLEKVYATSTCLIVASEGEGFGLPLIEAAQHGLSIIARDIPVFREVSGEHAFYFGGRLPSEFAQSITKWLQLYAAGQHQPSNDMPWLTWEQSIKQLLLNILP
ncbi:glycosyltransferase [Methylobacter sp. S3L5C]|uniref:glycosyltransferase n=1 Tax=Methylobacter sp. S3L5C TaxID=2839024 RepID=UPI001FAD68A1|nr:glycosyltransferase [Methylobacter sp. S3L5C]UOA09520.1 glycosyltransferase [Methylobacter sp. S3L5C]